MKNKIHKSFRGISFLRRLKIQEENSKKTSFLNYIDENKKKYLRNKLKCLKNNQIC